MTTMCTVPVTGPHQRPCLLALPCLALPCLALSLCSVIFGRGEPTRRHPGNLILREFVGLRLQEYMQTNKTRKSSIIGQVIDAIRETGARYLVPLDASSRQSIFSGGCREATRTEIRSKVSHAFRDGEKRALLQRTKANQIHVSADDTARRGSIDVQPTWSTPGILVSAPKTDRMGASFPISLDAATTTDGTATVAYSTPYATMGLSNNYTAVPVREASNQGRHKRNDYSPSATPQQPSVVSSASKSPGRSQEGQVPNELLSFATILTSLRDSSQDDSASANGVKKKPSKVGGDSNGTVSSGEMYSSYERLDSTLLRKATLASDRSQRKSASPIGTKTNATSTRPSGSITKDLETHCREIDIVFGRGAPLRRHPGNIKFRSVVESFNEQYGSASKHEKTEIIRKVIQEIQNTGAQFLIMENGAVKTASADEIRMKVSHRFRDFSKGSSRSNGSSRKSPKSMSPIERVEKRLKPSIESNGGGTVFHV